MVNSYRTALHDHATLRDAEFISCKIEVKQHYLAKNGFNNIQENRAFLKF